MSWILIQPAVVGQASFLRQLRRRGQQDLGEVLHLGLVDAGCAMPDLRHDVQEVVVDGDVEMARVVVTGTLTATFGGVDGTGRGFRIDQAVITHLRDGEVVEAWEIADIGALRAQVAEA